MNPTTQFLYSMSNMDLYIPHIIHVIIGVIISCVLLVGIHYLFLYHIGWSTIKKETRSIAAKKQVLGDLILMKDIQTEMEKEIEQASLRATFQG